MDSELPNEVKIILKQGPLESVSLKVKYKNYRGEIGNRNIIPLKIFYGKTEYHPEDQWLLEVWDIDKKDYRTYALKDIEEWIKK